MRKLYIYIKQDRGLLGIKRTVAVLTDGKD